MLAKAPSAPEVSLPWIEYAIQAIAGSSSISNLALLALVLIPSDNKLTFSLIASKLFKFSGEEIKTA